MIVVAEDHEESDGDVLVFLPGAREIADSSAPLSQPEGGVTRALGHPGADRCAPWPDISQ